MAQQKRTFTKAQQAAQQIAWGVGRGGLKQSGLPVLVAAAAALEGHPDDVSRERLLAEIEVRRGSVRALMAALAS